MSVDQADWCDYALVNWQNWKTEGGLFSFFWDLQLVLEIAGQTPEDIG